MTTRAVLIAVARADLDICQARASPLPWILAALILLILIWRWILCRGTRY